ncbi:hypothetical protein M9H77_29135 [Catharanthus roseus]|uniref:Uncharacterized protein n=1 Tax=Catharanthus roseus TaxID=4058 RepID=A0ACC0AHA9_CATRO|nr:hypothetical protein M9H77_29135 [Catharanthus roseus]
MVQTPFTWRYGGQRVFLCGSFDGWRERILMILVEGSATVFQRILDLPPGCYQYKFLVDDHWRVDEQQLCIRDAYGMINNVVFVTEQDFVLPTLPDNPRITLPVAPRLGGPLDAPVMQLAENDVHVLRYHLLVHLSASNAYDLMPDSGKVIALDVDVAVRQAFDVMFKEGVALVPLWDEQGTQIMGMLTASDFILILLQLHLNQATLSDEEIETHTISAWKALKFQQNREGVRASEPLYGRSLVQARTWLVCLAPARACSTASLNRALTGSLPVAWLIYTPSFNLFLFISLCWCRQQAGPDESLKDVALRIIQNKISAVPILSSTQDGSCPQLLCMACLGGILKCAKPVGDLPLGTWAREVGGRSNRLLLTLRASDPLSSALNLLIQAEVSSIPIVDDNGTLINVYCRSDITSLATGNLFARVQLDQTNISQAMVVILMTAGTSSDKYKISPTALKNALKAAFIPFISTPKLYLMTFSVF